MQPGQRTSVQFVQFDESRVFTLQNASSGSASEVYSDKRGDSMTKVVDDAMLQRLLDIYADQGLFARAERAAPPLARDALIVEQAERRWVFHRGAAAETVRAYFAAKQYFLDTYNRAEAFHSSDAHVRDLEAEDRRVRDSAESARLKLERLGGDRSGG
ncbi:MAG: hypothetical protein KDE27_23335, partial [Planctomycetes bacterium]|nr:hypothetical protein [Planctomycetota bacterium]